MWAQQRLANGKTTGYGLGWANENVDGHRAVGHVGGQHGASTVLLLDPEKGHCVVVLTNLEGADVSSLGRQILAAIYRQEESQKKATSKN
jgi:CubicO group peptidase (beta-lactamase class C family)